MSDLTSSVFAQLDQSHIESIAQQLGIDPSQASDAVQQALPLLMGGLARNATSPQGAAALHSALERDHSGIDIGGLLGSVLGGGGASSGGGGLGDVLGSVLGGGSAGQSGSGIGGAILGHIFGGRRDQAAQGLGQTSGLGGAGASQLLAMLAPMVMAALGNMTRKQGLDANALSGVLGQEQHRLQQSGVGGLLSGVLDSDGDGQVSMGEMLQAGAGLLGGFGKRS
ncbi:MAG: DUF937 domain-containing protein [Dokdonella sp.]|uniref:DUF937 domain-containing protein n=3 Tax=Dokdonella sp. TaxID=2291710 RepID=UPI002CD16271|nr:DUF937 domain-containing protein [Dokdonella sp.]HOX70589.1 DUF937 domain-containing protein [Dokdonella sp.]HPG94352.1 DUF937 domain-containing protein [Dokdonella sp.]